MEKQRPSTQRFIPTGPVFVLATSALLATSAQVAWPIEISKAEALRIGRKVWQNECGGSISGLTSWNQGENFASLGIGHFIWYRQGQRGPFEESFPKFLSYARDHSSTLPEWLKQAQACPWSSRAEFLRTQGSPQMLELRKFLAGSVDLQAQFLVLRLQQSLTKMLDEAAPADRGNVRRQFERVASTSAGCYALVDYVNFKGEGTLVTERYQDQGWGLLQVLEQMHGTEDGIAAAHEFSHSAAAILKRRVENSPPERHEARWLPGWINRVNSYRQI